MISAGERARKKTPEGPYPKWRLTVAYDGCRYHGWQRQSNHPTVQAELEKALSIILREQIKVVGSGRTDTGVHALGQVVHFQSAAELDPHGLRWRLNAVLPDDISVAEIALAPDDFHARYSAAARTYSYLISNEPMPSPFHRRHSWWIAKDLNIERAREGAADLIGVHDFAGFTVADEGPTIRDMRSITIDREGAAFGLGAGPAAPGSFDSPAPFGLIRVRVTANAFLHHMVRLIVGTLVEVAAGKRAVGSVREILESKDVRLCGPRAPAKGLFLERVDYDRPG